MEVVLHVYGASIRVPARETAGGTKLLSDGGKGHHQCDQVGKRKKPISHVEVPPQTSTRILSEITAKNTCGECTRLIDCCCLCSIELLPLVAHMRSPGMSASQPLSG